MGLPHAVPHLRRANLFSGDTQLASHRWTLDYEDDLAFFRVLWEALPRVPAAGMAEIVALLKQRPEIARIKSARRRLPT